MRRDFLVWKQANGVSFILADKDNEVSAGASKQMLPTQVVSSDAKGNLASSRSAGNKLTETLTTNLTPKQDYAIELLADFEHSMTRSEIASATGVCRRTIFDWAKRIPGWDAEIARRARLKKDKAFMIGMRGLVWVAQHGQDAPRASAGRTLLQYCGELSGDGVHVHQETHIAVTSFAELVDKLRAERGLPRIQAG